MGCVRCGGEVLCPKCDSVIPAGDAVGVVAALTAEVATLHGELAGQTKAMGEIDRERREALECFGRKSARLGRYKAELERLMDLVGEVDGDLIEKVISST